MNLLNKIRLILSISLSLLCLTTATAFAQSSIDGAKEGPAIQGYDTVAYFTLNKPVKGDLQFQTVWKGAQWLFSTAEHLELFLAKPESYAPQYGAYCAFAMSKDMFASGDPHRWKIVDGKLFLNTNAFAHWLWEKDIPDHIKEADAYWPAKLIELENKK